MRGAPTRVFNLQDVEKDIGEALKTRTPLPELRPIDFAPPAIRAPMPDYVKHREGINEVGRLSAEAVVREYEAAAKEIEALGKELQDAAAKCEAMTAQVHVMVAEIAEVAASYRDRGKSIFLQIESCVLMTQEARVACDALKAKIAGP